MRSAWLAAYFTQGDVICYHEAAFNNDDMDIEGYQHVGSADSGYVLPLSRDWADALGEHKIVVVERDIDEVVHSLKGIGQKDTKWLLDVMAPQLKKLPGLHVDYYDLDKRLKEIHDYLGIEGYCPDRHAIFANLNIQSQDWRS